MQMKHGFIVPQNKQTYSVKAFGWSGFWPLVRAATESVLRFNSAAERALLTSADTSL